MGKSPFPEDLTEEEIGRMTENDRVTHDRHRMSVQMAEQLPSPRLIKSHLPFQVWSYQQIQESNYSCVSNESALHAN